MIYFNKALDYLEKLIRLFLIVAMIAMCTVTIVEVGRRYFLGLSFPWAEELVRFLLIWVSFLGASIAWRRKGMVFFNLLRDNLSPRPRAFLDLAVNIISLVLMMFIFKLGLDYALKPAIFRQMSTGLHLSMAWVYIAIPTGFGCMILFTIGNLPEIIKECFKGGKA